jgi:hypothetical protein
MKKRMIRAIGLAGAALTMATGTIVMSGAPATAGTDHETGTVTQQVGVATQAIHRSDWRGGGGDWRGGGGEDWRNDDRWGRGHDDYWHNRCWRNRGYWHGWGWRDYSDWWRYRSYCYRGPWRNWR